MRWKSTMFAAALALGFICAFARPARVAAAETWLPISPEDLALKDNPDDPGADAMILYRENTVDATRVYEDGDSDREYIRIKIFTQAGTSQANVVIPVGPSMHVEDVAGRTIKPDGTIVKFEGKALESTITRRSGYKFLAKTFTLPDVQPGCIIEYQYQLQGLPNYVHDMHWDVSQDIFTREAHFTMKPYAGDSTYYPFYRRYNVPADAQMKQDKPGVYNMVIRNVKPIVDEPLMPSSDVLESRVEFFYLNSMSNEAPDKFWAHQGKTWNGDFEHFIDKKDVLATEVAKATSPSDSPEVKLAKLYARAQQIRNLDEEDAKTQKELKSENLKNNSNAADLVGHGYGHGREINYFFAGLARAAGFQAQEVRIDPVNSEVFNFAGEDPTQVESDDVVWVSANSKEYYLDPAARFFPFNLLPWYEQGAPGLRLDEPTKVISTSASDDTTAVTSRNAELTVSSDGSITGTISIDFEGQEAALIRDEERLTDDIGQKKDLEEKIKEWLPSSATFKVTSAGPWDQNAVPLRVTGDFSLSEGTAVAGARVLVPLDIFEGRYVNDFAAEKRTNVIYFRHPYQEHDTIKIAAPAGFMVGSLPDPVTLNAGAVTYSISPKQTSSGIEVDRQFVMHGTVFEAKYYASIRNIFGRVKSADASQAILQTSASANHN